MSYVVRPESFEGLQQEWEQLLPQCSTDTVFLTHRWQRLWWEQFGQEGDLCLLGLRNPDALQGIAPLMRYQNTLSFLGSTDLVDYHDFAVSRGQEDTFFPTLFPYLESLDWQLMHLGSLRSGSPTLERLAPLARERGYRVELQQEDVSPGVALPATWEEYLASLTKKDRHELRRKLRRLYAAGEVAYYACSDPEALSQDMDDFFDLMRKSRQDKSEFMTPQRERFFRTMARELSEAGNFRLYFLEVDGVRTSAALCLDYGAIRYLYNSGYDPAYAHLSVGLLLKALCLREAVEEGKDYFDFLRGSESYKYDLGGRDVALHTLSIWRPQA